MSNTQAVPNVTRPTSSSSPSRVRHHAEVGTRGEDPDGPLALADAPATEVEPLLEAGDVGRLGALAGDQRQLPQLYLWNRAIVRRWALVGVGVDERGGRVLQALAGLGDVVGLVGAGRACVP